MSETGRIVKVSVIAAVLLTAVGATACSSGTDRAGSHANVSSSNPPAHTTTLSEPSRASRAAISTTPAKASGVPSRPTSSAAPSQRWDAPTLVISSQGLGAVRIGMTMTDAGTAAGYPFQVVGDGVALPVWKPVRDYGQWPYLYIHAGPGYPVSCLGAAGSSGNQRVETPEGVRLGDPASRVVAVYGTRAKFFPMPAGGMDPRPGYVVYERGGDLVFKLDDKLTTVNAIAGGPVGMEPSSCGG